MPLGKRALLARTTDGLGLARLLLRLRAAGVLSTPHVTILNYHRVTRGGGPGFERRDEHVTPELLDRQVGILKQFFDLIDVRQLDAHVQGVPMPPNPAIITFDDGYRDNHDEALPVLRRHQAPATFFVSTRYVSERRMFWWDHLQLLLDKARADRFVLRYPEPIEIDLTAEPGRATATTALLRVVKSWPGLDVDRFLAELARDCGAPSDVDEERRIGEALVMGWEHVRALRQAGMDVQSHGRSHRVLTTLPEDEAQADLAAARHELEERIDGPVVAVAYPAGAAPPRGVVERAGYRLGFTSGTGVTRFDRPVDLLRLPRLTVSRVHEPSFFRAMLAIPALTYRSGRAADGAPLAAVPASDP